MVKNICIFEDESYKNLLPLVFLRPVFELRCGMTTLREKIVSLYPEAKINLLCRDYLAPTLKQRIKIESINQLDKLSDEGCLFLKGNGLFLATEKIPLEGENEVFLSDEAIIGFRLNKKILEEKKKFLSPPISYETLEILRKELKATKKGIQIIKYPWDLITNNSSVLANDYKLVKRTRIEGLLDKNVTIYGDQSNLYLGKGSRMEGSILLDLREGPIYIGENVLIRSQVTIEGPTYIGESSIIDRAKIGKGTSIGPVCRIGGEVEESIFHGYDNKHHEGYVGHSYLGEWVNLGAMTTTSNLKNTYGLIKVHLLIKGLVDSGEMKLGAFVGDYTKIGTGVFLSPGTVIGVNSNIDVSGGKLKGNVPSFIWNIAVDMVDYELQEGSINYDIEKAIIVAERVMKRRGVSQNEIDRQLLRKIYKIAKEEREKLKIGKTWSVS